MLTTKFSKNLPLFWNVLKFFEIAWNFLRFLKFFEIFWNFWNFWNFLKFLKFFEIFWNFWNYLFEFFEIFWNFWNFWIINCKFFELKHMATALKLWLLINVPCQSSSSSSSPYNLLLESLQQAYSARHLRFYAWVTRFTFSAAISKSLELKRSLIPL